MADIEYRFGTGEGDPHVHHGAANVDVDGNGTPDAIAVDFDGDGRYDDAMWDSDGDGVADTALLDTDDDGTAESAYSDPSGEGTWNAHGQGGGADQTAHTPPDPEPQDGGFENQPADDNATADTPDPETTETSDTGDDADTGDEDAGSLFEDFLDSLHDDPDTATDDLVTDEFAEDGTDPGAGAW